MSSDDRRDARRHLVGLSLWLGVVAWVAAALQQRGSGELDNLIVIWAIVVGVALSVAWAASLHFISPMRRDLAALGCPLSTVLALGAVAATQNWWSAIAVYFIAGGATLAAAERCQLGSAAQ